MVKHDENVQVEFSPISQNSRAVLCHLGWMTPRKSHMPFTNLSYLPLSLTSKKYAKITSTSLHPKGDGLFAKLQGVVFPISKSLDPRL